MRRSFPVVLLAALLLVPSSAPAAFHLIEVREVYSGASDDSYVVLQMLAAGENLVGGHSLRLYDSGGAPIHTFTFSAGYVAPNGGHGNNTILAGDTGVQSTFGVIPDDHADPGLNVPAGGGAACWLSGIPPDCVAWGNFTGHGALPAPGAGTPADPLGIPAGMALRRTIAAGCPTLLEASDDSDNSAADFSAVFPAPRPNSVPPPERACESVVGGAGGGGAGAGGGRKGAPQTKLRRRPPQRSRDRTPTFRFAADEAGASFECRLDRRPFRKCRSPFTARRLSLGRHAFGVRARDATGLVDPTPAFDAFRVVRRLRP